MAEQVVVRRGEEAVPEKNDGHCTVYVAKGYSEGIDSTARSKNAGALL